MMIGVEQIRNMLLNKSAETVARYISNHAADVPGSLVLLDKCLLVMDIYAEELKNGGQFIDLFVRHPFNNDLPQRPAMPRRAKNFSKAVFRFVVDGMPLESKAVASRRLAMCERNQCGFFDGSVCRHINCGCYSKIKTFFASEHCPVGLW